MVKSVSTGIRIPLNLYNLVMSANPNKTFNDVIKDLLTERYSFNLPNTQLKQDNIIFCAQEKEKNDQVVCAQPNSFFDVESEVDKILSIQHKKDGGIKNR